MCLCVSYWLVTNYSVILVANEDSSLGCVPVSSHPEWACERRVTPRVPRSFDLRCEWEGSRAERERQWGNDSRRRERSTPEVFMSTFYWVSDLNVKRFEFFSRLAEGHTHNTFCYLCVMNKAVLSLSVFIPGCQTAASHSDIASFVLTIRVCASFSLLRLSLERCH